MSTNGGSPAHGTPRRWRSGASLAAVVPAIVLLAVASTTLTFSKLRSSSQEADDRDRTFSAPTSLVGPTIIAEWSLSDKLAAMAGSNATRIQRSPSMNAAAAADAAGSSHNANTHANATRSKYDARRRTGGMHLCTCLTDDNPLNTNLPAPPKRIRWLHIPKTGTSFISTLWSYAASTSDRYIDLSINSHACVNGVNASYSMYDFALMRRYPWEVYGAQNLIPKDNDGPIDKDTPMGLAGGTQHVPLSPPLHDRELMASKHYKRRVEGGKCRPPSCMLSRRFGSEVIDHNLTVATFFRQPEDRIVSAYYDGRHSSGFPPEVYQALVKASLQRQKKHTCPIDGEVTRTNPLECFAKFPGIAGCMARMLTGESCADGDLQESGLDNLPRAIDLIMNHLDFVGLMDEWNESICQFHRLFMGKVDDNGRRHWDPPLQGEFSNKHKSTKKKDLGVEHMRGFKDVADNVVYEAAKLKFERIVGGDRCYRYSTWDELKERKTADDADLHFVKLDDDGKVCQPKTCADLGKQCGAWDDGCGRTVICGMCDPGRTGLPSTWRVRCSKEGRCVDYCPPWVEKGYWSLSDGSLLATKNIDKALNIKGRQFLSPTDAVAICEKACDAESISNAGERDAFGEFVSADLCQCGTPSTTFVRTLTPKDFSSAHDLNTMCGEHPARMGAFLLENDTQPICCPYLDAKMKLPSGWKRLYTMGQSNLEGEYFANIPMECGAMEECEAEARRKKAEMAVFDMLNSMCHLARNVVDLGDTYSVTKDNQNRFFVDLR